MQEDLVGRYGPGAEVVFKRGPYLRALEEVRGVRVGKVRARKGGRVGSVCCASLKAEVVGRYGPGAEVVFRRGPYLKALEGVRGERGGRVRARRGEEAG